MVHEERHDWNRRRLFEIIREKSFSRGPEITLASGRKSNFYFNMKPTMLDGEAANLIAEMLLERLKEARADLVGGLEMGAVPLVSLIAAAAHRAGLPLGAFFVRKQAKGHGTQQRIEGLAPGEVLSGKRVVILEDVTTTGGSAIQAVEECRAVGAELVGVITLVDRGEGAADAFAELGLPLDRLFGAREFLSGGTA